MMSYSKASLQSLIRNHLLRPTAKNNTFRSLLPLSEDITASEIRSPECQTTGFAPVPFRFGLAAKHFADQARIEVRGRPIKIDDDVDYDDDRDTDEDGSDDENLCSDDDDMMVVEEEEEEDGDFVYKK